MVPSAHWMMLAPLSTPYTTALPKSVTSVMKLSPARVGMKRHAGHTPASPIMLLVDADESRASPVPCP